MIPWLSKFMTLRPFGAASQRVRKAESQRFKESDSLDVVFYHRSLYIKCCFSSLYIIKYQERNRVDASHWMMVFWCPGVVQRHQCHNLSWYICPDVAKVSAICVRISTSLLTEWFTFSKHRPSGPMLSISRNIRPSVCVSVCPSVHFWGTV